MVGIAMIVGLLLCGYVAGYAHRDYISRRRRRIQG